MAFVPSPQNYGFPYYLPPPSPFHPLPPHQSPPPPHQSPPPPQHCPPPPPQHPLPPPHPLPISPPPPHILPPPPPNPNHTIIIIVATLGGFFLLAFLACALVCCIRKKKKKAAQKTKAEVVNMDDHVHVTEAVRRGPHGEEVVVLDINEELRYQEVIRKDERVGADMAVDGRVRTGEGPTLRG